VRSNHQTGLLRLGCLQQQADGIGGRGIVQAGGGLIGQDERGRHQHSARQRHALGLPARELRGQAPGQRLHTQCLQHLRDTRAILSQTSGPIGQRQVVAHGERRA